MGTHPIFESDFDCLTDRMSSDLSSTYGNDMLMNPMDFLPTHQPTQNFPLVNHHQQSSQNDASFLPKKALGNLPKAGPKISISTGPRASPSTIGPKTPDLPNLNRSKRGDFQIQPFGDIMSQSEVEKNKLEADCIRYKLAAEDANEARDRLERQMKQLSDEISGLKIKLNSERARHAETAEQSRALTHLAAQLRSKNEKIEKVSEKQQTEIKILRKRAETADDDLILQTSRVDALTKICDALEQQVREAAIKNGCPPNKTDIAARWRQEAYKYLVQMSHSETKLLSENRKLRSQLAQKNSMPGRRGSNTNPIPPRDTVSHSKNKSF